jgi:hypothetical protein
MEQKRGRDEASQWQMRRRQALRRAVLAAGGERGAQVGRQQQRVRAVRSRGATRGRGEQKVAGGEQGRRITPAAEEQGRQSRRKQRCQEGEGDELNQGLFCKFREKQGLNCKGLATFKPMLK